MEAMDMEGDGFYRREVGRQPPSPFPAYRSTVLRAPLLTPVRIPQTATELTGPADWAALMVAADADLTAQHRGAPIG